MVVPSAETDAGLVISDIKPIIYILQRVAGNTRTDCLEQPPALSRSAIAK